MPTPYYTYLQLQAQPRCQVPPVPRTWDLRCTTNPCLCFILGLASPASCLMSQVPAARVLSCASCVWCAVLHAFDLAAYSRDPASRPPFPSYLCSRCLCLLPPCFGVPPVSPSSYPPPPQLLLYPQPLPAARLAFQKRQHAGFSTIQPACLHRHEHSKCAHRQEQLGAINRNAPASNSNNTWRR